MAQLTSTTIYGNLQVNLDTLIQGLLVLTDTTASTSTTSGALRVTGGVGIAEELWVGGSTHTASVYLEEDAASAYYLRLFNNSGLTAGRTLNLNVNNADRTISLAGNLTLANNLTTSTGAVTIEAQSGGSTLNLPTASTISSLTANHVLYASAANTIAGEAQLSISRGGTGLATTSVRYALLGPTSAAGAPTWRAITSADISDATNASTANMVVKRDGSGNFSAGTITAALSGNATTATTASKVANSLVLKFDTGATPDTDIYTFDGSAAKTIDIKGGTNVTLTKAANVVTISSAYTNYYPTSFAWTGGTAAGPTGSLTVSGTTAVSFAAIPSASASASGIVTNGTQTFAGVKTFNNTTDSTSTTTGAVIISGGLGVAKDIWAAKYNNLTLTAAAAGFAIAGGTTSRTLTLGADFTTSTGAITLAGNAAGSSVTLPASGTLVPDSRKVAGMALSSDITLKTLTISSPLSGTSYDGSAAVSIGLASGYGDTQNPYASKTAKYFLAAPNGAAGAPTFRAIEVSDIPTLNQSTTGNATTATTASKVANTLTLGVSGTGLSGSATFNGSSAATFTVTSNATSSNTGSTIVARDSSGNFSAGTINGIISTSVAAGSSKNLLYSTMADSDYFRIQVGGASNAGYVEIATADDGSEPIHVRQYTGAFTTVTRTATLLDGSGNTTFPGIVTASSFDGSISATSHTHSTYDRASSVLSGANVFSNIVVTDGIVTGTATRELTYSDVGAAPAHSHPYLSSSTTSTQDGYFGNIYLKDDTDPSHYLIITDAENLTANRTLSIDVDDANRILRISGDAVISGTNTGDQTTITGNAGSANKVNNAVTFNNGGSGAASGTTFDGSTARTISYNTIGAAASSHAHGSLSSDGKVGTTTDQVVVTGTGGAITTASRSGIDSRSSFPPTLDKVYPVGAVYLSVENTSPASLFGGTWAQIGAGYALWTATSGAGSTIAAGLPNITGYMYATFYGPTDNRVGVFGNDTGGAIAHSDTGRGSYEITGQTNGYNSAQAGWTFDASGSSSIYGESTTVQPPAYKVYAWKRTA